MLTGKPIPPEVETFLREIADSFLKLEIVKFFYKNPTVLGSTEQVGHAIGRKGKQLDKAIGDLLSAGVIKRDGQGQSGPIWYYSPHEAMRLRVMSFMDYYYRDRETLDAVTDYLLEASL
jgi:predicted transcriptional regulator